MNNIVIKINAYFLSKKLNSLPRITEKGKNIIISDYICQKEDESFISDICMETGNSYTLFRKNVDKKIELTLEINSFDNLSKRSFILENYLSD
jgi:hypothetical protein